MQVDLKALNGVTTEVTIDVDNDTVKQAYHKFLGKASLQASIPGFRKGKAPLSMVLRTYGDKLKDDFINYYIDEVFAAAVREKELSYLFHPEVKEVKWEEPEPFHLVMEIEHEPEVTFQQLEGLRVPHHPLALDQEVDAYIAELQKSNSTLVEVEEGIQEGDEVEFEASMLLDDYSLTTVYKTQLSKEYEPELCQAMLGKKIGDTAEVELPHQLVHHIFAEEVHEHHAEKNNVTFMVNAIRRTVLPVVDDEFAKDLEFDSLADMRSKIADELAPKNALKNEDIKLDAVLGKLYQDNPFDLPHKTIDYLVGKEMEAYKVTDKNWRQYYEYHTKMQFMREFAHMYLMSALRKQDDLQPTDEDIAAYCEREAKLADQSVEEWKDKRKELLKDNTVAERVRDYLVLKRIAATCDFYIPEPEPEAPANPETGSDAETAKTTKKPKTKRSKA